MIPQLPTWTVELVPEGFALIHPEGADVARMLYRERMTPVRRVADLTRMILAGWPEVAFDAPGPIERLVTDTGEHAAIVTVLGRIGDVSTLYVQVEPIFTALVESIRPLPMPTVSARAISIDSF